MKIVFYFLLLSLSFCLLSCDTNEPPSESLYLTFEDASCTEVWLKLNDSAEGNYVLKRDGKQVKQISLSGTDNIIYDDSLQPNTTYNYQLTNNKNQASSNEISALTMDTTSHDFTWETFTFGGQGGSSTLYDVAIVDENNIWAVGEIYTADNKYNAVHWDGSGWELLTVNYGGHFWSIRSVFAFSENEVWFSAYVIYDGERFIDLPIPEEITGWGINKTWGISSSNFYVVGNGGNIAHYDGSNWKKIESGTELSFQDIWGGYNTLEGNWEIIAAASNHLSGYDTELVEIKGKEVHGLSDKPLTSTISSTWFIPFKKYVIGGSGIYSKYKLDQKFWERESSINKYYTYKIRGNSINDIIAVGGFGDVQSFNGVSWKSHFTSTQIGGNYLSVSIKENIVAVVGNHNASAAITIGRR